MNTILIYGPGCAKCTQVLEKTKLATAQLGGEFSIQKVTNPMQFAVAGVFITPALSLNGKLLFSGRTPSVDELKDMLQAELSSEARTESCCSGSCGCDSKKEPAPSTGCGCGCGCSGEKEAAKPNPCKKLLLWAVIIVLILAAVKTINRSNKEESSNAPSNTSAAPVASDTLTLTYYKLGVECITCQRMDQWIQEAINTQFADEIASGRILLQSVKPSDEQVEQYQLTTKTLIASMGDTWSNIDQIWALKDDETAFKAYIIAETQKLLK